MTTTEIDDLLARVKERWSRGEFPVPELLALVKAKKVHNHYATVFSHLPGSPPNGRVVDEMAAPPPRASNPIAFREERSIFFLAEDAERVRELLHAYATQLEQHPESLVTVGTDRNTWARVRAGRVQVRDREGVAYLALPTGQWNDWIDALGKSGVVPDVYWLE